MNTVEGFFAVGAIVGPAIVATLTQVGRVVEVAVRDRLDDLRRSDRHRCAHPVSRREEHRKASTSVKSS